MLALVQISWQIALGTSICFLVAIDLVLSIYGLGKKRYVLCNCLLLDDSLGGFIATVSAVLYKGFGLRRYP